MLYEILTSGFDAPDTAILLERGGAGVFFAISGYHKLANPTRHAHLAQTMRTDHIPLAKFNEWFVPTVEFVGGVWLTIGFLTALSALALLIICAVACICEGKGKVAKYQPIDSCDVIDDYLYLPEVVYMVMLGGIWLSGGGVFSIDYLFR